MDVENKDELKQSEIRFQEHVRNNLVYPKIENSNRRFFTLHFEIVIGVNYDLESIKVTKVSLNLNECNDLNNYDAFYEQSIQVIKSFNNWALNKVKGENIKTTKELQINFFYHRRSLSDKEVVLNPQKRVDYLSKSNHYQYTIEGTFGCDGLGYVLAIIIKHGEPQDIECFGMVGKTNFNSIKSSFLKLGNWIPAVSDSKPVDSQLSILIYT